MDKNAVLEILTSIENKINESKFAKYTKDLRVRPNIVNILQERIDELSNKLDNEKNYLGVSTKDYNDLNKDYLSDCEKQKKANEERIKSIDYRLSKWEKNKAQQEKELKALKKELSDSTKADSTKSKKQTKKLTKEEEQLLEYKNMHLDPRDEFKNALDQSDEQALKKQKEKDLEQIKKAISSLKKEKENLVSKNKELEREIKNLNKLIEQFPINTINAIDNVLRRHDSQELNIYKESLKKYKSQEKMYTDFFQEEIKQLKEDYSNNVITTNILIEKLELLNERLNVKFKDEELRSNVISDLIKETDDFIEELKLKVLRDKNYEYTIQPSDEEVSILNRLKDDKEISQAELNFYRPRLDNIKEKNELWDSLIRKTNEKSDYLKDKTGRFVSTVKDEREKAIEAQIDEYSNDVEAYKNNKKIYLNLKGQVEKIIVWAEEANKKIEEIIKAYEKKINSRTGIDVYAKEEDIEKIDTLVLCKLILGFKTDMIDFSIEDELKTLREQNSMETTSEKEEILVDNNGNQIPSFLKDELNNQDTNEEDSVQEEISAEEKNEEPEEVKVTQELPSFVYEQLEKEEKSQDEPIQEENKAEEGLRELTDDELKELAISLAKNSSESPSIDINVGDDNVSFDQTFSEDYKELDGNEFVDDGIIHKDLAKRVRTEDYIGKLNNFFLEQQETLNNEVNEETQTDEITVDNNGEEYTFDLGNQESVLNDDQNSKEDSIINEEIETAPVTENNQEQQDIRESTMEELEELRNQLKEYKGGTYGK